ncbi:MAG: Flp family type IVb pilin [Acidocella sp.]|nr:Flp family type IVb pilin [Acidocella sp.]
MNINRFLVSVAIRVCQFTTDRRGVTAIEYVMIASLVAILIVAGATLTGHGLSTKFGTVANGI